MILQDQKGGTSRFRRVWWFWLGGFLLAGILTAALVAQINASRALHDALASGVLFTDLETRDGDNFVATNGELVSGAQYRTTEKAFSGKYSLKFPVSAEMAYGLTWRTTNFAPGDHFRVQVWQFAPGSERSYLVAHAKGTDDKYVGASQAVEKREDGWERLQIDFVIPYHQSFEELSFYVYSQGTATAYFDDFSVQKVQNIGQDAFQLRKVELEVAPRAWQRLKDKRAEALERGMLVTEEDDWVKAKFITAQHQEGQAAKIRLKGDWLDHLKSDKWSFRVKLKDGGSWNRMIVFSLQNPSARYFLHEWFLHQLFEKEDVLTTTYDFVELVVNGESLGVYAYEEHFQKQLVESRDRREGPIIRFEETGYWAGLQRQLEALGYINYQAMRFPAMEYSEAPIGAFSESKLADNPTLSRQFDQAVVLLEQLRTGELPLSAAFDLDRMAKYYALSDVLHAYHGITWHNQRFYFNPITNKIEPIGYDGFGGNPGTRYDFLGEGQSSISKLERGDIFTLLFLDRQFVELYHGYLYKFSSRQYLNDAFNEHIGGIEARLYHLNKEFPDYTLTAEDIMNKAQYAHGKIMPLPEQSLHAYRNERGVYVLNRHPLPLAVVGYMNSDDLSNVSLLKDTVFVEATSRRRLFSRIGIYKSGLFQSFDKVKGLTEQMLANKSPTPTGHLEETLPAGARYVVYVVPGIDSLFRAVLRPGTPTLMQTVPQLEDPLATFKVPSFFHQEGQTIYFPKGETVLTETLRIPRGYQVVFPAGAKLVLNKGAAFISWSPVSANGRSDEFVEITTTDNTGQGFHVLSPSGKCTFFYTDFSNLETINKAHWNLTGAVTFYEADVEFNQCRFRKNRCEDGLNLVRSTFQLNKCLISDTPFDGFDSDFCKGTVENSIFQRTNNDGLDCSGSMVWVKNCQFIDNGDKGISAGEASDLTITNSEVNGAAIGVAAKDLSLVVIQSITLRGCEQGFVAYQKKPEYGGGKIVVEKYTETDNKRLYNISPGSILQLDGALINTEN